MVKIPRTSLEQIDLDEALGLILRKAAEALCGSAGVLAVWDESLRRYSPRSFYGLDLVELELLMPILTEAVPDLASSRRTFDLLSDIRPGVELPTSGGVPQDPIIALPLKIGEQSIGLIYVLRSARVAPFCSADQQVLSDFAEQSAIAVHNAGLAALLAEEKNRLESVLENSADGIMSLDSGCRIVGFNTAMEKMTGYSRENILGRECFRLLQFQDTEGHNLCDTACPMKKGAAEAPVYSQKGTIRSINGRRIDVEMVCSIVRTPKGQPLNAVVNVRNISRRREMEEFRETILSMLAHELQTPLSIIKGYTSTLCRVDGAWDMETVRQGLQVIEEESDRLSLVMNKLLLASRLSAGGAHLNLEEVDLPSLASKVAGRLAGLTSSHEFKLDFPADFPAVKAETQLIEQAVTNLMENAIKYSPEGGTVAVTGTFNDKEVEVSVADRGIGISAEEMDHLFERFYRAPGVKARKIQGTGLGLYICKAIMETHGGSLEASSRPGRGSKFTFRLPLVPPEKVENS